MIKVRCLTILLLSYLIQNEPSQAQNKNLFSLESNAKVPNISLAKILNYKFKSSKISDYKGKLLILDFWFTGCSTCISQFPRLDALQKSFDDRICILPVGFDAYKEGSIEEFVMRRKGTVREMKLPTAIQGVHDTILLKLFPGDGGFPREIWISPKGNLIAVTDQFSITKENIKRILNGDNVQLGIIKPAKLLDACSTFLIQGRLTPKDFSYGSIITGYDSSIDSGTPFDKQCYANRTRLFIVNQSFYALYKCAYQNEFIRAYGNNGIIVEPSVKALYSDWLDIVDADNWTRNEFKHKNLFCYELILPPSNTVDEACHYMINDLDRYFNIDSKIAKRIVKCLVLMKDSVNNEISDTSKVVFSNYSQSEDFLDISMKNFQISYLVNYLSELNFIKDCVLIDETNYTNNIDFEMHLGSTYDLNEIRKNLKKYGLSIMEDRRELDMLILTPKHVTE